MINKSSRQITTIEKVTITLLVIFTADLFLGYIPLALYFLVFVLLLYQSSKVELSFILIFFPGIMIVQGLYGMGYGILILLLFTGIMLIYDDIRRWYPEIIESSFPLVIILAGFLITYSYAPKGYYAAYKIIFLVINGVAYFLFLVVYIRSKKFNNFRIALFLIFIFIFLVKLGIQRNIIYGPRNFYDFGFIRYGINATLNESIDSSSDFPNYQSFGALALFSIVFLISTMKKIDWLHSFILLFCIYLSLLAGARQMIYGIVVILFIYFIMNAKSVKYGKIMFIFIIVILFINILRSKDIPFISDLLVNKDVVETIGGRKEGYEKAIGIFKKVPIFGNGIGGFAYQGEKREYPHNIILEIMAEGGLFMLILIASALVIAKRKSNYRLKDQTENGTLYLLIILSFAVKAFSSSDLVENIALISALCAIGIYKKVNPQLNSNNSINNSPKKR